MSACGGGMQLVLITGAAGDECSYDCGPPDVMFTVWTAKSPCEIIAKLSGSETVLIQAPLVTPYISVGSLCNVSNGWNLNPAKKKEPNLIWITVTKRSSQ